MRKATLIIKNAVQVLTCRSDDPQTVDLLADAYVAIEGKRIVSVGRMRDLAGAVDTAGAAEIDATGRVVLPSLTRSEERRVGKECRSRWSPYH